MDKNGLPWEENDYVKMNICVQNNGLKMQQFWTDSLDDPVVEHDHTLSDEEMTLHQFINGLKTRRYNIYTLYSKVKVVSKERKSICCDVIQL